MKLKTVPVAVALASALAASPLLAQEEPPATDAPPFAGKTIEELSADDVLKLVRYSYTLFNREFGGQLRLGLVKKIPFRLVLKPESIRFVFNDPPQVIYLDTRNKDFSLLEGVGGDELKPVTGDRFGETIRGTDATYDDLSMRFLYWPNARIIKEEKFKTLDTWLVRVRNPDDRGLYSTVDCWIDKGSGGLIKMLGYNRQGRPIRRFEVLHGKKFGDVWMVDEMRIETISSASGKVLSSTRMQITEMLNQPSQ
ncbi:MAG: outer membrane lipoprotein-sorting protein [Verrucomicrobiales bacterium]|nr:outer membrane lipoprotein-sorting protein [Verrucomicrobiales bacterium]